MLPPESEIESVGMPFVIVNRDWGDVAATYVPSAVIVAVSAQLPAARKVTTPVVELIVQIEDVELV